MLKLNKLWKILKEVEYQTTLPVSWETCMQDKKQQLEPDMEQQTGSKLETVTDFIFLGSKITADGDCSHEIKRCFAPWKKNCDKT